MLLLHAPTSVTAHSHADPAFIQIVIDAPDGPHDRTSDETPFVEAIEEVELGDESQDDEPSFHKKTKSYALTVSAIIYSGFNDVHAPRGALVPIVAYLLQDKLYLDYHQLKVDC